MFDDEEGGERQHEPEDWWHHELNEHDVQEAVTEASYTATNLDGESVQAAINARLRRTTRLTFFDDESGDDEMHIEPDDYNMVTGLVDKRGLLVFSKAAKYTGTWMGIVFKLGPLRVGLLQRLLQDDYQPGRSPACSR